MNGNKYKGQFENLLPKIIAALIIFLAGVWIGQSFVLPFGSQRPIFNFTNTKQPAYVKADFNLFWDVYKKVSESSLNKGNLDPQKLLYGAISGMVKAVGDPYSVYLDPGQNEAF